MRFCGPTFVMVLVIFSGFFAKSEEVDAEVRAAEAIAICNRYLEAMEAPLPAGVSGSFDSFAPAYNGARPLGAGIFAEYQQLADIISRPNANYALLKYIDEDGRPHPTLLALRDISLGEGLQRERFEQVELQVGGSLLRPYSVSRDRKVIPIEVMRFNFSDLVTVGVLDRKDIKGKPIKDVFIWDNATGAFVPRANRKNVDAFSVNSATNRYVEIIESDTTLTKLSVFNLKNLIGGEAKPESRFVLEGQGVRLLDHTEIEGSLQRGARWRDRALHGVNRIQGFKTSDNVIDVKVRDGRVMMAIAKKRRRGGVKSKYFLVFLEIDLQAIENDDSLRLGQLLRKDKHFRLSNEIQLSRLDRRLFEEGSGRLLEGVIDRAHFSYDGGYLYLDRPVRMGNQVSLHTQVINLAKFPEVNVDYVPKALRHPQYKDMYVRQMEPMGNSEALRPVLSDTDRNSLSRANRDSLFKSVYLLWGRMLTLGEGKDIFKYDISTSNRFLGLLTSFEKVALQEGGYNIYGADGRQKMQQVNPVLYVIGLYEQAVLLKKEIQLKGHKSEDVILHWVSHDKLLVKTRGGQVIDVVEVDMGVRMPINNTDIRTIHEIYDDLTEMQTIRRHMLDRQEHAEKGGYVSLTQSNIEQNKFTELALSVMAKLGNILERVEEKELQVVFRNLFQQRLKDWVEMGPLTSERLIEKEATIEALTPGLRIRDQGSADDG